MSNKFFKKISIFTIGAALVLGQTAFMQTAFAGEEEIAETSIIAGRPIEEYTLEEITKILTPAKILDSAPGFRVDQTITGVDDDNLLNGVFFNQYTKENGIISFNQFADYPDGYFSHMYFSTDPNDVNLYVASTTGAGQQPASSEKIDSAINTSITEYESFDDIAIISAEEIDNMYHIFVEGKNNGLLYFSDEITIDPSTGYVVSVKSDYYDESGNLTDTILQTITYGDDIKIDTTPKEEYENANSDSEEYESSSSDSE